MRGACDPFHSVNDHIKNATCPKQRDGDQHAYQIGNDLDTHRKTFFGPINKGVEDIDLFINCAQNNGEKYQQYNAVAHHFAERIQLVFA